MKIFLILSMLFTLSFSTTTRGDEKTTEGKSKRSTEVNFDDVLVQGKYHFSDEAVTTVEQDKVLNGLLSVRKDFSDRIKNAKERF